MILSYPDYFTAVPVMPRGIPVMPGYPSIGEFMEPVDGYYRFDENQDQNQNSNNTKSEKKSSKKEKDTIEEDTGKMKDKKKKKMGKKTSVKGDENSARQHSAGSTGGTASQGGSTFEMAPGSPVSQDINYTQGYLRTQIGKRVRVTFLLGTGTLQDRTGILQNVGISYIILRNEESNSNELGDIYSIKFVTIFD